MDVQNEKLQKAAAQLKHTIWVTKGARFDADRRLKRKHEMSLYSISLLSLYTISASMAPWLFPGFFSSAILKGVMAMATLVTGVFILIVSNLEARNDYSAAAEKMFSCALKLSELHNKFSVVLKTSELTTETLFEYQSKYETIIAEHRENHKNVDFFNFISNHPRKFDHISSFKRFRSRINYLCDIYLGYGVMITLPILIFTAGLIWN